MKVENATETFKLAMSVTETTTAKKTTTESWQEDRARKSSHYYVEHSLTNDTPSTRTSSSCKQCLAAPEAEVLLASSNTSNLTLNVVTVLTRCGVVDYIDAYENIVGLEDVAEMTDFVKTTTLHYLADTTTSPKWPKFQSLVRQCLQALEDTISNPVSNVTDENDNGGPGLIIVKSVSKTVSEIFNSLMDDDGWAKPASCMMACVTVFVESRRFDELMTSVCVRSDVIDRLIFDAVLEVDCRQLANRKFRFGDTPLVRAARARRPDIITSLLRHGADVSRQCEPLDAFSTLLFSPNLVERERDSEVGRCLRLMLAALPHVPVARLVELEESGNYYPLFRNNWRPFVSSQATLAWCGVDVDEVKKDHIPVAPLKQLAKCVVRDAVCAVAQCNKNVGPVPWLVQQLPIPGVMKNCLLFDIL